MSVVDNTVQEGSCGRGALDTTPFCVPCDANVCYCEDRRKATYFTTNEEEVWYDASNKFPCDPQEAERYWSSEDEDDIGR